MKKLLLASVSSIVLMAASPANADPISLVVAAASTATTVAAAGGLTAAVASGSLIGLGLGYAGFAALAVDFAVRATLGYALNALVGGRPRSAVSRGFSRNVNQLGSTLPHQVIYGETVVGGAVFYQALSPDNKLHKCIAFAGHEIDSYQAIFLNDKEVTLDAGGNVTAPAEFAGHVRIKQYLGTDTQPADSDLVSEVAEWTTAHKASGIAYLYVAFEGASNFSNGAPVVSAKIRGRKIFDTRTSVTAWSDNPAMCLRDYLLANFGLAEDTANIDDTLFEAAADVCDTNNQFTCNGAFTLDATPEDIIRNLLSSMGGTFWNYSGNWAANAATYQTPVLSLGEDDLRGEIQVATRHSRRDNFNTVKGQYKGAETNYQPDNYEEVGYGSYIIEDGGLKTFSELDLLFTDTEAMSRRIAQIYLRRNRRQITVVGSFGLRALDIKIGDNLFLNLSDMGWTNKVFEVVDWRLGITEQDIVVNMMLREMEEEVYTGVVANLTDESNNVLTDESGNILEAIVA